MRIKKFSLFIGLIFLFVSPTQAVMRVPGDWRFKTHFAIDWRFQNQVVEEKEGILKILTDAGITKILDDDGIVKILRKPDNYKFK